MERRMKTLYSITIIAILSFLGMQGYWLYGQYSYSLIDYEHNLAEQIVKSVDSYNEIRKSKNENDIDYIPLTGEYEIDLPTFSLSLQYGDPTKITRTTTIRTYRFTSHELSVVDSGIPLTRELIDKATELAQLKLKVPTDSVIYDVTGAKNENDVWIATNNIQTERQNPFDAAGLDSILNKTGISAHISLAKTDSIIWESKIDYCGSAFNPRLSVSIPYSQLEGKTAVIECKVNPFDVLPRMWLTLIISVIISTFLIVCLVLQFSTVLKLSRLDEMRNRFITTMIHELKRPISTLKMCVSGLDNERMLEDRSVRKELLTESRKALDNLSAYFSKLRDITFNNVEQIPLNVQNVNLHDLFDTVVQATVQPSGKNVIIHNDIASDTIVSADRAHLYNILNNLVENAVKYSGPEVKINAMASVKEDFIEFMLADNGNGIPASDLKHIFKRFYRGKASSGELPGMGLGLSYVKLLVEAHGGDISVYSFEGRGTCFTIKLPQ
ncbi:MAG: HAMP domain-containing histidine kinase [Paramuribaculum sp.]|nr:HAMP domain-containing histidine kinase [Paramuribaculum sp.]